MHQHILHAVIRHDEAKPLGDIEPFDHAGDFDEVEGVAAKVVIMHDVF